MNAYDLQRDLSAIQKALGVSHDDSRDMYAIYGWDKVRDFSFYYAMARYNGIGARLCFEVPKKCWANGVDISDLEDELKILKKAGMFNGLMRGDQLGRVYKFAAVYVGVPDGLDPREPLGKCNPKQLGDVYFQPFAYDGTNIIPNGDILSKRYGLPEYYNLSIQSRAESEKDTQFKSVTVHHSRVIHIAETLLDSNIEGVPYLEPIANAILSLDKTYGGAAEAYFRNARGKYFMEMNPEFAAEFVQMDKDDPSRVSLDADAKAFTNSWRDYMLAAGMKVSAVTTPHASPKDTVDACWQVISAYTGLSKRILTGEGAGQLAGSEDKLAYNAIIDDRQNTHCVNILNGALDILMDSGLIKRANYEIKWPLENPLSETEKAQIANTKADALSKLGAALSNPVFGNLPDEAVNKLLEMITGVEIDTSLDLEELTDAAEPDQNTNDREAMDSGDQAEIQSAQKTDS